MAYEIMVLNPRKGSKKRAGKKRRKSKHRSSIMAKAKRGKGGRFVKKARKSRRKHRKVAAAAAPRRRRRRAGGKRRAAVGYVVGSKRIRRRKLNPRHRRRARRHNPRFSIGGIVGQVQHGAMGAAGGLVLDVGLGYVSQWLPDMLKTGYAKHATRIAGALGLGWLARKFLPRQASAIGGGAMTIAMYGLLKDVVVQFAPNVPGLGDYEEITLDNTADLGAYLPGTGAYLPSGSVSRPGPVGAYMMGATEEGSMLFGLDS